MNMFFREPGGGDGGPWFVWTPRRRDFAVNDSRECSQRSETVTLIEQVYSEPAMYQGEFQYLLVHRVRNRAGRVIYMITTDSVPLTAM